MKFSFSTLLPISILSATQLFSIDWNQYRGLQSNNKTTELLTSANWLKNKDNMVWKTETPLGFSSFTTENGKAYTLIAEEDEDGLIREVCIALDLRTGKRIWKTWLCRMDFGHDGGNSGTSNNKGGDGPRSTPSVFDGKVWIYDSDMNLYCLDAKNGKVLWDVKILKEYSGRNIKWKILQLH